MSHVPYGYRIRNGEAVIDQLAATQLQELFRAYLSGLSLTAAGKSAGINGYHATFTKMLMNKHYLGDDYYPQIIERVVFEQVQAERISRAQRLGRIKEAPLTKDTVKRGSFTTPIPEQIHDDPFKQAEYAYSLIESEVISDDEE